MNILYGIFTCQKYLNTRCEWISNTWLKDIDEDDKYFFISHKNIDDHIIGFDVPDDYRFVPLKYLNYILYIVDNDIINSYDWFHFSDDDCYIFPNRLKENLEKHKDKNYCIFCRKAPLNNEQIKTYNLNQNSCYPGGGASFSINRNVIKIIYEYLKKGNAPLHVNSDISFGIWINKCGISDAYEHSEFLGFTTPSELKHPPNRIKRNITYHYCSRDIFMDLKNNYADYVYNNNSD